MPHHRVADIELTDSIEPAPVPSLYWVKAIRELGAVGAIIAIAAYTVFKLVSGVPTTQDITDVKRLVTDHVNTTNSELVNMRALLRAICFNTAKSDNERAACQVSDH